MILPICCFGGKGGGFHIYYYFFFSHHLIAELNAQTLGPRLSADECAKLASRNDAVLGLGRKASLGLVHFPEEKSLDQMLETPTTPSSSIGISTPTTPPVVFAPSTASSDVHTPVQMTPQILQDYQGEIERLKFRLKKRKGKMMQLREEAVQAKDNESAALKSVAKYEKHIKRLERESEESLLKEQERRKATELSLKNLKRRVQELEFLLEDDERTGNTSKGAVEEDDGTGGGGAGGETGGSSISNTVE